MTDAAMADGVVVGVVLAAGRSERMGGSGPKQLLRFGDRTMVAVTVGNATASVLDRVLVVVGHAADEVTASIPDGRHQIVENPQYPAGSVTSLRAGIAAAGPCEAVAVLPADLPGLTAAVIDAMVGSWRETRPWAMVTEYAGGEIGHPFLLSADAVPTAVAAPGPRPLWTSLVEDPPHPVARLRLAERPPVDVDTPGDYMEALRRRGT